MFKLHVSRKEAGILCANKSQKLKSLPVSQKCSCPAASSEQFGETSLGGHFCGLAITSSDRVMLTLLRSGLGAQVCLQAAAEACLVKEAEPIPMVGAVMGSRGRRSRLPGSHSAGRWSPGPGLGKGRTTPCCCHVTAALPDVPQHPAFWEP